MKKIICLILSMILVLGLFAGCDNQPAPATTPAATNDTTAPATVPSTTPATAPTEPQPTEPPVVDDTAVKEFMNADLTALEVVHEMGNGTNLGNTMEACDTNVGSKYSYNPSYYETSWGQPITTKEMIQGMKDAGFDSLRIPVAWMTNATNLATTGDYTIAPEYLDRVEEIVQWALEADMYVIINDHWDGGWYGMFGSETQATRDLAMEAYIGMWKQIAERFAQYDYHLIFEGANEEIGARFDENSSLYCSDSVTTYLSDNERYELANKVNQAFVDTVRGTGGNNVYRFLLIPGYGTNIANTCDDRFQMPNDIVENRLLISVHYYDPWSYCGDGQSSVKWGTKNDIQNMMDTLAQMTKFTEQGVGVVIGEYGVLYATEVQANTDLYHQCFLSLCDVYNYTSCLWDCSAFFKRSELTMVDELATYYAKHNFASHINMTIEEEAIMGNRRLKEALNNAPDTFRDDVVDVTDDTLLAWIMWTGGDYQTTYSVGDVYNPDSMTAGIQDTTVLLDGAGTYTVALDFSGTAQGFSANVQFAALGITNAEALYPGCIINITEVKINGQVVTLTGNPFTTCDAENTTRVNLYNEWITVSPDQISAARCLSGNLADCTTTPLDRNAEGMAQIVSIEVTFEFIIP